jgi:hypothetical protein
MSDDSNIVNIESTDKNNNIQNNLSKRLKRLKFKWKDQEFNQEDTVNLVKNIDSDNESSQTQNSLPTDTILHVDILPSQIAKPLPIVSNVESSVIDRTVSVVNQVTELKNDVVSIKDFFFVQYQKGKNFWNSNKDIILWSLFVLLIIVLIIYIYRKIFSNKSKSINAKT